MFFQLSSARFSMLAFCSRSSRRGVVSQFEFRGFPPLVDTSRVAPIVGGGLPRANNVRPSPSSHPRSLRQPFGHPRGVDDVAGFYSVLRCGLPLPLNRSMGFWEQFYPQFAAGLLVGLILLVIGSMALRGRDREDRPPPTHYAPPGSGHSKPGFFGPAGLFMFIAITILAVASYWYYQKMKARADDLFTPSVPASVSRAS